MAKPVNLPDRLKRQRCAWCGKRMPLDTSEIDIPRDGRRPDPGQLVDTVWGGGRRTFVEALRRKPSRDGLTIRIHFWTGRVRGYGPFCKQTCSLLFARAAHNAGYRRSKQEPTP